MKSTPVLFKIALAAILASSAGLTFAAGTQTLAVTANVQGICKFSAASTPLAFGSIDPSLTTDKVVTANVLYKCTNKTPSTGVTATGGNTRSMAGPTLADTLAYTLAFTGDTQTGLGFGTNGNLTLVVTGTITALQYQNVAAGAYSENVTLNILP